MCNKCVLQLDSGNWIIQVWGQQIRIICNQSVKFDVTFLFCKSRGHINLIAQGFEKFAVGSLSELRRPISGTNARALLIDLEKFREDSKAWYWTIYYQNRDKNVETCWIKEPNSNVGVLINLWEECKSEDRSTRNHVMFANLKWPKTTKNHQIWLK